MKYDLITYQMKDKVRQLGLNRITAIRTDIFEHKFLDSYEEKIYFLIKLIEEYNIPFKVTTHNNDLPHVKVGLYPIRINISDDLIPHVVNYSKENIALPKLFKKFPLLFKDVIYNMAVRNCSKHKDKILEALHRMLNEIDSTRCLIDKL